MKRLFVKYKELITYVIFGALTTAVNFVTFWLMNLVLGERLYLLNNIIAWVISVAFAYVTNKLWVFESKNWNVKVIGKEIPEFVGARLFSLALEEGGLLLFMNVLHFGKFAFTLLGFNITGTLIAKVILAVIVVIINYIFSKLVIFKNKKDS